jgi:hypothetical protein
MSRRRIIGVQPVILALMLGGCPSDVFVELGEVEDDDREHDPYGLDPWIGNCKIKDPWEPNASAHQPRMMAWEWVDEWTANHQIEDAGLCAGDDDWYHYEVQSLGYVEHYLYIRALVEDAGLCGEDCGQPVLPAGPKYAMTVEVYRADNMQMLTSDTDDDGVLVINGPGGEAYEHDLLIHVFSETHAQYRYRLSVEIRNYDGEDECEC